MTVIETSKLSKVILQPSSDLESFEGIVSLSDLRLTDIPDETILLKAIGEDVELKIDISHNEASKSTLVYTGFLKMYRSNVKLIITL